MIKLELTDNLIVTDSNIVKDIKASMYAIVSVSGSMDSIVHVAEIFKEKLSDKCMSLSSFEEWMEDSDNQIKLLDMLTSLYLDPRRCSFHCYLSDHTFSKFLFVIRTLFPELNLRVQALQNEIESLYASFDKTLLLFENSDLNKEIIDKIYSFIKQEAEHKKYNGLCEELNKKQINVEKVRQTLTMVHRADMSLFDYANYSNILLKLLSNFKAEKKVLAFEHSFVCLNFYKNTTVYINKQDNNEFELKKIDSSDSNVVDIFINNLQVLFHYFWNRLHIVDTVYCFNEQEQLLIATIWILFQSPNSAWMMTTENFRKLKQLLDIMRDV